MTIDEEFVGVQRKLLDLVLQTCQGTSRHYSTELLRHFGCQQERPEPKDFRKLLRQFLTKLDDKYSFTAEEQKAFVASCKILEKENKPTCCRIF